MISDFKLCFDSLFRNLFTIVVIAPVTTTLKRINMDNLEILRKKKMEELKKKMEDSKTEIKIEVNDGNFEEKVIKQSNEIPVVVDFWATWCTPCVMLGPTLEKLAVENKGKFILAKLNVDGNPVTSQRYGIMSIPAVKMFKDGKVADEFVGVIPEPSVREWIDKNVRG